MPPANFSRAQFSGLASFRGAQFSGDVNFRGAQFDGDANFSGAQFAGDADFGMREFNPHEEWALESRGLPPAFRGAQFAGDADFVGAVFRRSVVIGSIAVSGHLNFSDATFHDDFQLDASAAVLSFGHARFSGRAELLNVRCGRTSPKAGGGSASDRP